MIQNTKDGVTIQILVQPKASKSELVGIHGNAYKIRIQAPPVDGAANEAVIEFFSQLLKTAKKNIQIIRGETSRQKTVLVQNVEMNFIIKTINP